MEDTHEVVKLLLARMESNPEEFGARDAEGTVSNIDRWWHAIGEVKEHGSEKDKAALAAGIRTIKLKAAHEWALNELLNGEEDRRKVEEEKRQRVLEAKRAYTSQSAAIAAQLYNNQYQNAATGLLGTSYDPLTNSYRHQTAGMTMSIPREAVEEVGLVAKLKKGLGI